MNIATKNHLMSMRGPGPISERFTLPNSDQTVAIHGIVTSAARSHVYHEVDEMVNISHVSVDGQRVEITEDDVIAACWAAECVTQPKLTSYEWLLVAASNPDTVAAIGVRCLVCSRLIADPTNPDGISSALAEVQECGDPLVSALSSSVSTSLADYRPSSNADTAEQGSAGTKSTTK